MVSKAFGEQNPTQGETPVSWKTWSDGFGGIPNIVGNPDWGKLSLPLTGYEGRSAVYDLGSTATRSFTLTENRYGTGTPSATLQYRANTSSFLQDDVLPVWTTYTAPFSVSTRYIQVRETTTEGVYYYISSDGDDGADGLTLATAWKTLAKVNASSFSPMDSILLNRGDTWNERLILPSSGSVTGYITFSYYGDGAAPIIDGTGISITWGGLVQVHDKNYIKIIGLNVINSGDFGIFCDGCSNIDIQYNTTESTHSSGIGIWSSDNVRVNHNTVINARCVTLANGGHEESISIAVTTNFEVGYNDVSMDGIDGYIGNEGIDCKAGTQHGTVHHNYIHGYTHEGGAIYVDGWDAALTGDIDIFCNRCWGNPNGIVVNSERSGLVDNVNIYNNQVYNVYETGIGLSTTGTDGPRSNINIYHNTIYKAQYNGGAAIFISSENVSSIAVFNNITYFGRSNGQIVADEDAVANIGVYNNLSYGSTSVSASNIELSTNPGGYPTVHDNLTGDPDFVSLLTPDLHIQPESPALDAAYSYGLATDYDGIVRPQYGGVDIGAFEINAAQVLTFDQASGTKAVI